MCRITPLVWRDAVVFVVGSTRFATLIFFECFVCAFFFFFFFTNILVPFVLSLVYDTCLVLVCCVLGLTVRFVREEPVSSRPHGRVGA